MHATLQRIEVRRSALLACVLCAIHAGAAAAIGLAAAPWWGRGGLMLAIGASLAWTLYARAMLRTGESVIELAIDSAGRLSFLTRAGAWHACQLLGTTYVSPSLTLLNLKPEGRRFARHVVLVPDNVDPDDFRRLRTWLRWAPRDRASGANGTGMSSP